MSNGMGYIFVFVNLHFGVADSYIYGSTDCVNTHGYCVAVFGTRAFDEDR